MRGVQDENSTIHNFLVDCCEAFRVYEENTKPDQLHEYEQFLMTHTLDLAVHRLLPTLLLLLLQSKCADTETTTSGGNGRNSNPGSERLIKDMPNRKTKNVMLQKVSFHLEGSKVYENIRLETDMFHRENSSQFILLSSLGFCVEMPISTNVFPYEIRSAIIETVGEFNSWVQSDTRYLIGQAAYRERETMRLVFHFDEEKHLFDQSGRYFAGMS